MQETQNNKDQEDQTMQKTISSYMGLSLFLFLAHLPNKTLSLTTEMQTQMRDLKEKLFLCEEELMQMKSRRREDSKANARVVEIFASHRQAWQAEERRLLQQIDEAHEQIACLRAKVGELESKEGELKGRVGELERDVGERDEMIGFMSRGRNFPVDENGDDESGDVRNVDGVFEHSEQQFLHHGSNGFASDLLSFGPKFWSEKTTLWQDIQYQPAESLYPVKIVARRESPWKVDSEDSGVSSKLKLLEQELLNVEKVGHGDLAKVPSYLRKQAKRYQALAGKIDDLCQKMQASDPCEPNLSPEYRTQRQTEFLLEAFRLQQRASETGQKLKALQTEIGKIYRTDNMESSVQVSTRRSLDLVRNNFKEIQRNLEIWLARIIGDLEGILARDGASRVREYQMSRYPFVQ